VYVTAGDLDVWRRQARSLERAATYSPFSQTLQRTATPERVATVRADGSFFATLGVAALHGRTFRDSDPPTVVVASFGFWRRHFAGDPAAVGRSITLDGEFFTLLGVMPERFQFPYRSTPTDLWTPWAPRTEPTSRLDAVIGRLRPDVTVDAARRELSARSAGLMPGRHSNVTRLGDVIGGPVRRSLLVLLGAVGFVLLAACANVANLLLARAAARRRDLAVRRALGAGRGRLIRQSLAESLLLAISGGVVGLLIGKGGSHLLLTFASSHLPRAGEIGFDWRVFAFLTAVCVLTGVGVGLVPALGSMRGTLQHDLTIGERGSAVHGRLQDGLVVAEIALAFMLIVGAGLLLRTFLNLQRTPTGFTADGVLTLHLAVADAGDSRALIDRVSRIPGVTAAGFISLLPLQHSNWFGRFAMAGRPGDGSAEFRYVTPRYFDAIGIPLRRGRGLTDADTADAPKVLLVNEALAARYFPNEDPIGRVLTDRGTIVGVVGDVRQSRLDRPADPEIYYPVAQNFAQLRSVGSTMVVRSAMPPEALAHVIREAIREVRPGQAVFQIETLARVVAQSIGSQRLSLWLLTVFAAIAMVLAATGIYGVIAYLVTLRTREYGIRLALGASRGQVLRLVLARGSRLIAIGLGVGVAGALALTRFLQALLYGVSATDPATLGAAAGLLAAVALLACLLPARRAARVNPLVALRAE
jgi:predicted permease